MSLVRLAGSLLERVSGSFNAGLPAGGGDSAGIAFGVDLNNKLKSLAGPVRGQPPVVYKNSGKNVRLLGFEQHPVVQACMRVIVDTVCSVPLEVCRRIDGEAEFEPIPGHKLQKLLDNPAPTITARQLRSNFALNFITYGNAFWRLVRTSQSAGAISQIRPVNPEGIQVVYIDADMNVISWLWVDHFGRVRDTDGMDIVHFRDLQLPAPYIPDIFGYPRVATALNSIVGDTEATKYVRQIVTNDGTPTLALLMSDGISQQDAETAQERWHQLAVERGRRGRAAFVGGVKEVKPIGFNLRNLEFPDLRRVNREDICASLGVDPRMVGISSATNDGGLSGQQYVEARSRLAQHTIEPLLVAEEDTLNAWLSPEYGNVFIRYSRKVLADLIENDQTTSERVRGEFKDGLRTLEEAREAIHLPPTPDPTDALWVPSAGQLVPAAVAVIDPTEEPDDATPGAGAGGAAGQPPASAEPAAPAKPAEPAAAAEPAAKSASSISALTRSRLARGVRIVERGVKLTKEQRGLLWGAFDQRATKEEVEYRRTAQRLFDEEAGSVDKIFAKEKAHADTHRAQRGTPETDDPFISAALRKIKAGYKPGGEYHQRWLDSYRALIGKTYMVSAQDFLESMGLNFNLDNPAVHKAIQDRVEKLGTYVTDTTARQVTAAVAAGRKAGMGIGDIARLVQQSVYGPMSDSRAERIARTETIGAMNQGEFDTAQEQGVMQSKEWLTQQDDRVRDSHAELDGVRIGLSEDFDNGLSFPGDQGGDAEEVINCRCTLLYYDEA